MYDDRISLQEHSSEKMPVFFLGHGSPMNAIEENQYTREFKHIAATIPTPTSIVCISAHWLTKGVKVTAMEHPKTIRDFGGFPEALYQVRYPAKGNPTLAQEIKSLLAPVPVELDESWGLDHGSWTIIKHIYPDANIPIVQLSLDDTLSAQAHFDLSKRLLSLRSKGVLIIGSGNIIHNLRLMDFKKINDDNYGYDWAIEAKSILNTAITLGNFQSLIMYEKLGESVQLSIPTSEHYLPLLYTLALKESNEPLTLFNDTLVGGSLSMTSVRIG